MRMNKFLLISMENIIDGIWVFACGNSTRHMKRLNRRDHWMSSTEQGPDWVVWVKWSDLAGKQMITQRKQWQLKNYCVIGKSEPGIKLSSTVSLSVYLFRFFFFHFAYYLRFAIIYTQSFVIHISVFYSRFVSDRINMLFHSKIRYKFSPPDNLHLYRATVAVEEQWIILYASCFPLLLLGYVWFTKEC